MSKRKWKRVCHLTIGVTDGRDGTQCKWLWVGKLQ